MTPTITIPYRCRRCSFTFELECERDGCGYEPEQCPECACRADDELAGRQVASSVIDEAVALEEARWERQREAAWFNYEPRSWQQ